MKINVEQENCCLSKHRPQHAANVTCLMFSILPNFAFLTLIFLLSHQIRSFPSREFYAESLEDAPDVKLRTTRAWHAYRCYGPFCFFDLHEGKESQPPGSGSWVNVDEAEFVLLLYHKLVITYPELKSNSQVAIISPYSQQVKLIQEKFKDTFGIDPSGVVDITSVDGCQVIGLSSEILVYTVTFLANCTQNILCFCLDKLLL